MTYTQQIHHIDKTQGSKVEERSIECRESSRLSDVSLCGCQHCWQRTTKCSQRPPSKHGGNKCWGEEGQWGENKLLSRQLSLAATTVNKPVYVGNIKRSVNGEMSKPTVPTFTPPPWRRTALAHSADGWLGSDTWRYGLCWHKHRGQRWQSNRLISLQSPHVRFPLRVSTT